MNKERKNMIIRFILPICISLSLLLMDGLNILTVFWKKERAEIIQVTQFEYPINTRWRGTIKGYSSNARIKYNFNNHEYTKDLKINFKASVGEEIDIRINKEGNNITAIKLNYFLYYALLGMIIIYYLTFIIIKIYSKMNPYE